MIDRERVKWMINYCCFVLIYFIHNILVDYAQLKFSLKLFGKLE